jgi:hypothetical protein
MSSATSVATKLCCACGADVTGQPRMKDSHNKYWCMPCGEADQRRKQAAAGTHGLCAMCRQPFPKGKLEKHGEYHYCKPCAKKRTHAGTHVPPPAAGTIAGGTVAGMSGVAAAVAAAEAAGTGTSKRGGGSAVDVAGGTDKKRLVLMGALLALLVIVSVLYNFVFA